MNQIQTELPTLRHAGAVIEYTVHEDDLEERDFPPIQDRTWGPIPPLAGSIDIGLLCRREPGPICFRASGNIATLFLSIGKALLDLVIAYDPVQKSSPPITIKGLFTIEIESDRLMIAPLSNHPRFGSKFAASFAQFSEELFPTAEAVAIDHLYFFRNREEAEVLRAFETKMKSFRTEIWNLSIEQEKAKM